MSDTALATADRLLDQSKAQVVRQLEWLTGKRDELTMAEEEVEKAEAELQVYNNAVTDAQKRQHELTRALARANDGTS